MTDKAVYPTADGQPPPYPSYPTQPQPQMGYSTQPPAPPPPTGPTVYSGTQHTVAFVSTPGAHVIYRDVPMAIQCPECRSNVTTRIEYSVGMSTWAIAGIICLVGGWLGCCLIPFCVNSCKDAVHYCPNCNAVLGKYNKM